MKTQSRLVAALGILLLAGCASSQTTPDRIDSVPPNANKPMSSLGATPGSSRSARRTQAAGRVDENAAAANPEARAATPVPPDAIRGHCVMKGSTPIKPCPQLVIILKDPEGMPISQKKTDANGNFTFRVKENRNYFLEVQGTSFDGSFSPSGPLQAGTEVQVKVRATRS